MRKRVFLALLPAAGLLSLLWLSGSQSTALASSSTTEYRLKVYVYGDGDGGFNINPEYPDSILSDGCDSDSEGFYCYTTFSRPQNVTLEAEPETGSVFAGWGGDCSRCGTNTTCTINMDSDKVCSVTFTASSGGSGGSGSGSGGSGTGSGGGSSGGSGGSGGSGSGSGGSGTGSGGGGGGCSMTGSASSMAGLWNILVWLSVPAFVLARRIRRK
jgi:uncharacterized repeat protein (TIGR02543 family)